MNLDVCFEYLAVLAGFKVKGWNSNNPPAPSPEARVEFLARIANPREEYCIGLESLACADDFRIIKEGFEHFYDGPVGPQTRKPVETCFAFGKIWERHVRWFDHALDSKLVWYMPQ